MAAALFLLDAWRAMRALRRPVGLYSSQYGFSYAYLVQPGNVPVWNPSGLRPVTSTECRTAAPAGVLFSPNISRSRPVSDLGCLLVHGR